LLPALLTPENKNKKPMTNNVTVTNIVEKAFI